MAMTRSVEVPTHIVRGLEALFGCSAAGVRVYEHSLLARAHLRAIATTRRERIYLRGSAREFFDNPSLMLHEYCHVLYQWRTGTMTTWRYLVECARRGYWNNRFEIEARAFAERHAHRLRMLLAQSAEQSLTVVEAAGDEAQ